VLITASISISNSQTPSLFATPKVSFVLEAGFGVYFHPNLTLTAVRTPELQPRARVSIRPRLPPCGVLNRGLLSATGVTFPARIGAIPHIGTIQYSQRQHLHPRPRPRPLSPSTLLLHFLPEIFCPAATTSPLVWIWLQQTTRLTTHERAEEWHMAARHFAPPHFQPDKTSLSIKHEQQQ
jgi:hypothetical protein